MQTDNIFTNQSYRRLRAVLLITAVCCGIVSATAQVKEPAQTGTIIGSVVDDETGEKLPWCNVTIGEGTTVARTDSNGTYLIADLAPGLYSLSFRYIGYRAAKVDSVLVKASDTVRVVQRMVSALSVYHGYADSARKDIAAGKVRIMVVGLIIRAEGDPTPEEEKSVTTKYGFVYDYTGCDLTGQGYYNQVAKEYLDKRNGPGWEERVRAELEALRKSHRPREN